MEVQEIQNKIKESKNIMEYDQDTLKYIQKPIGKALFMNSNEEDTIECDPVEKRKALWNDRIKCKICGNTMLRSNQSKHKTTKYHMAFENMNNKIREMLLK